MTQKQRLKEWLQSGKSITRLTSYTELGIFELSARICGLESDGIDITKEWITVTNRYNEQVRVMEYRINGANQRVLI
jgi:hypothetical protein